MLLVYALLIGKQLAVYARVLLQWVTVGDVDVDIGANPSAEEADEGTESSSRKVVDVVDSFRLVVSNIAQSRMAS